MESFLSGHKGIVCELLVGCGIEVMIAAATNGLFDYFGIGVLDSGVITIAR